MRLNYDKIKLFKSIINILEQHKIEFKEINTYEGDLEDVFKIIKNIIDIMDLYKLPIIKRLIPSIRKNIS